MTKSAFWVMMMTMMNVARLNAQYSVELEPDTAKRKVIAIDYGTRTAELYLHPQTPWKIGSSRIAAQDDFLWSGPYGSYGTSAPHPYLHRYLMLGAHSSREYVKITGVLTQDGSDGTPPWFRVTVPSVDIDWAGYESVAQEEGEDTRKPVCPVTNDMTKRRKLVIRNPLDSGKLRDDPSLLGSNPDMRLTLLSGYADCFRLLKADGSVFNTGAFNIQNIPDWPLELYVDALPNKPPSEFIITLEGPAGPDGARTLDKIRGMSIKVEMITPAGDPVNSPVDSGDGQNEFTYSPTSPGVLTMYLKARVTPSGVANQIKDQCVFTVDMIAGSTLAWGPSNPGGKPTASGDDLLATVTFTGLPANNTAFGSKKAAVYFDTGKQDEENYEVFFNRDAQNSPIPSERNWYHYWVAALGVAGQHTFNGSLPTSQTVVYSATSWTIQIGANANWPSGNPPTGGKYINGFWASNLHEFWHRDHRIHNFSFHGGWTPQPSDDLDGDGICDREPNDPPGHTGGWEAIIGTNPSVPNSTEDGANWAEQQGSYGHGSKDWSAVGSQSKP